jgi:hypothetical protein
MRHPRTADLEALLRALQDAGIESIVVGGAAAVIHGAPISTQDLDIVPRQTEDNLTRLAALLDELDARFRPVLDGRDLAPTAEHLRGTGQLNLATRVGPLDIRCRLHDTRGYDDLVATSTVIVDGDLSLRVLDLDALIAIKASTGRAKDDLLVPILRAMKRARSG